MTELQTTTASMRPGNSNIHAQLIPDGRLDTQTLTTSEDGRNFIMDFEKTILTAYDDSNGYCTIGTGHLIEKKSCQSIKDSDAFKSLKDTDVYANEITKGEILNGITKDRASQLFSTVLPHYENVVKNSVTVNLYQYEFDALVSFVYNTGSIKKYPNLFHKLNNAPQNVNGYAHAAEEMRDITNGGLNGLVIRRQAEINLFNENIYNSRH